MLENRGVEARELEELAARLARVVPAGMRSLRGELEQNFRVVLRANLERLELVSRERFDAQAALLARTQSRLAALEQRLQALEQTPDAPSKSAKPGRKRPPRGDVAQD